MGCTLEVKWPYLAHLSPTHVFMADFLPVKLLPSQSSTQIAFCFEKMYPQILQVMGVPIFCYLLSLSGGTPILQEHLSAMKQSPSGLARRGHRLSSRSSITRFVSLYPSINFGSVFDSSQNRSPPVLFLLFGATAGKQGNRETWLHII